MACVFLVPVQWQGFEPVGWQWDARNTSTGHLSATQSVIVAAVLKLSTSLSANTFPPLVLHGISTDIKKKKKKCLLMLIFWG